MHVATRRVLPLAVCAVLLASRPSIAAETDAALQHPLARSRLSLVDAAKPSRRRVAFNARFTPRATMDNPAFAGATLRIYGSAPTDGDSGLIELKAAKWHPLGNAGSKGYRYEDETGAAGGIRLILVKQGKRAGTIKIAGGSENWRYAIGGPQSAITLTLTVGKARWCAEFDQKALKRNVARHVVGRKPSASTSCPCDSYASTFAAIQNAVFERHGCTQAVCHGAANPQGGLDLRPDVAYANLVDVPSKILPDQKRVEPGLAAESLLWRKLAKATQNLAGVPGTGMPNGLPPIPDNELEAVRLWIHAGAPETGVVIGTEALLSSCLPPPEPIKIRPPAVPDPAVGVQLHAPAWTIAPRDPNNPRQDGEDEVCYATYYNFTNVIPEEAKTPCPDFWGGPTRTCFFLNRTELTQDPNSHHSIIHLYKGAYDSTRPGFALYTCQNGVNGAHDGTLCNTPAHPDCTFADGKGGQCLPTAYDIRDADSGVGPFTCHGGANDGIACDPLAIGVPAPAGADCGEGSGCAGKVKSGVACLGYGPPDFGFDLTGSGSDNSPNIGGSQQPVSKNVYPPGAFNMLPVDGVVVWNSHAFNLTSEVTTNEQFLNVYYAGPSDRTWPVHGIFDARDIFVQNVPPFEKREYCRTFTLPKGARLFQLSSHTHKRGKLFRIWGPGITQECGSEDATKPADCAPESGPSIFTTTDYSDPMVLTFDPPVALDGDDPSTRRYKFCSRYDNGADVPLEVKRRSTSPTPPLFVAPGGPCKPADAACLEGPHKGEPCNGDDRACDSAPGANDGSCDACPLRGGVTTEDEMFILLGGYYVVP
jgi:hypothetical protein